MLHESVEGKSPIEILATLKKVFWEYPDYHDPDSGCGDFEDMVERFAVDDFYNLHYVAQAYLKEKHKHDDRFVRTKTSPLFKTPDDVEKHELVNMFAWETFLKLDDGSRIWLNQNWNRFCVFQGEGEIMYVTRLTKSGLNMERLLIAGECAGIF